MTYCGFHFLLFVRFHLGAGAALAIVIHLLSRERGIFSRATLLQEFDLWSSREPKGSCVSVNREISNLKDGLVLLKMDGAQICDERLRMKLG